MEILFGAAVLGLMIANKDKVEKMADKNFDRIMKKDNPTFEELEAASKYLDYKQREEERKNRY